MMGEKIQLIEKDKCAGCMACVNACPKSVIKMEPDDEGFLYPIISYDLCIACGQCKCVCPAYSTAKKDEGLPDTYAAINLNEDILKKSTSGGVFSALADIIREKNGYVVGCVFNDDMEAVHKVIPPHETYDALRGSKYVQSNIGGTYQEVKKLLNEEKYVLFTGAACQIDGLYSYLGGEYDKLYTCDIICHGVSSPGLWQMHKNYLEGNNRFLINYSFRDKSSEGWGLYYCYYYSYKRFPKLKLHKTGTCLEDEYFLSFLTGKNYRVCCYSCKYASLNRVADFTLGDFWGVEKYLPDIEAKAGVSALLINTEKGKKIKAHLDKKMKLIPVVSDWIVAGNKNLHGPTIRPQVRDTYYELINKVGYKKIQKQYKHTKQYLRAKIMALIPLCLKNFLRKVKQ